MVESTLDHQPYQRGSPSDLPSHSRVKPSQVQDAFKVAKDNKKKDQSAAQARKEENNSDWGGSARLADYFAVVGLNDNLTMVDSPEQSAKTIEKCEIVIMEKQEVSEIKQKVNEAKKKLQKVINGVTVIPRELEDLKLQEQEILAKEENKPYELPPYDFEREKWIDLDGTQCFYLRLIYGPKNPITEINFYYITSRYEHKISIPPSFEIQPVEIKRFKDPEADKKFYQSKKKMPNGDVTTVYHGAYDMKHYLDRQEDSTQHKGKVLVFCTKRVKKIYDQPICDIEAVDGRKGKKLTIELPQNAKIVPYQLGLQKQRLLIYYRQNLMKARFKAKILDRYPQVGNDRKDYPFQENIASFCFPQGIMLHLMHQIPQTFNFTLTDADGNHTYGTCLFFDEKPSEQLVYRLKKANVENFDQVWTQKAICIMSHYSFLDSFKTVLSQLYRIHLSSQMHIPLERFIQNFMDEVPLPDKGNILVQHDIGNVQIPFFRPIDSYPPYNTKNGVENLFKCLQVDDILEIFVQLILERKILLISRHKQLLTDAAVAFMSFIFPLHWKHSFIPILPSEMIDVLDAPFPYLIGIQQQIKDEELVDVSPEVAQVFLDSNSISTIEPLLQNTRMPREFSTLRNKLIKATQNITKRPDPSLEQVDHAFTTVFVDPDDEEGDQGIDEFFIRDAFLEFMSRVMSDYKKYIKDPGSNYDGNVLDHANSKDFFMYDKFRQDKDASKPDRFLNKLTQTIIFGNFIEARCLGKTEHDQQIMYFDQVLKQQRSRKTQSLVSNFKEKKVVKALQPTDEGLNQSKKKYTYNSFPNSFKTEYFAPPRQIHSLEDEHRTVYKQLTQNEQIKQMPDPEWARYMAEVIYCLWFQIFSATLPMYKAHASELIYFARKLLQHIQKKLGPLKEVEIIYRRLFEACGQCQLQEQLRELYREMQSYKHIDADKVTYGTYYQALLLCKREGRSGRNSDRKISYLPQDQDLEAIETRLKQEEEKERIIAQHNKNRSSRGNNDDFDDLFERQATNTESVGGLSAQDIEKLAQTTRLSQVLENSLFIEFCQRCSKCEQPLHEEELLTGLSKSQSEYTVKCPFCQNSFVPLIHLYSEYKTPFINGREGLTEHLLPPVPLYKEFINTLQKTGDGILTQEKFIKEHSTVFWNLIVYFKLMKLPSFMLDMDYSQKHIKVQVSWIKKYLPNDKSSSTSTKQTTRSSFGSKPRLDKDYLKKLEGQQAQSPVRNSSLSRLASGIYNAIKKSASKGPSSIISGGSGGGRGSQAAGSNAGETSVRSSVGGVNASQSAYGYQMPQTPISNLVNLAKKGPGSVRSGDVSVITSTSDAERIERLMTHARYADKYIVKFFGKQFEEFRRDMALVKEIIMSDSLTNGIPESMARHTEKVNLGTKQSEPFRQAMVKKYARATSELDNFSVEDPAVDGSVRSSILSNNTPSVVSGSGPNNAYNDPSRAKAQQRKAEAKALGQSQKNQPIPFELPVSPTKKDFRPPKPNMNQRGASTLFASTIQSTSGDYFETQASTGIKNRQKTMHQASRHQRENQHRPGSDDEFDGGI